MPNGVAERGGELFPGDRLVFVNEKKLHNTTLPEAVEVLKSAPPGNVRLGICKPLLVRAVISNYTLNFSSSVKPVLNLNEICYRFQVVLAAEIVPRFKGNFPSFWIFEVTITGDRRQHV